MGSSLKQSWKLQEFVAHGANVNCLAMGHKSNQVLVTGGDDKKVNLWAIGRHSCLLSLSGHTTPVESVCFGHSEDIVCAGSQTGVLKIWDLEAPKLLRTLTGHKGAIKCMDFHPYGDYLTSGSCDTTIKFWDIRKKGCIFTYSNHDMAINSVQFSPDGQWLVSGGEDGDVKVWDVRVGKVLKVFRDHSAAVMCVRFHPHEFLLASSGADKVVNFWDMEKFQLVSTIEKDNFPIRHIQFSDDGSTLLGAASDGLKVIGWEPSIFIDSVSAQWGQIHDMTIVHNQLILGWFHSTNVILNVVDLAKINSNADTNGLSQSNETSPFQKTSSVRKSFSKDRPAKRVNDKTSNKAIVDAKIIEESTSGTEPEEEPTVIPNFHVYEEIFRPSRALNRTPPASTSTLNSPEGSLSIPERTPSPSNKSLSLRDLTLGGLEKNPRGSAPSSLPSDGSADYQVPVVKPATPPQTRPSQIPSKYTNREKYKSEHIDEPPKPPLKHIGMHSPPVERSSQLGHPNSRLALRRQHSQKEIVRNSPSSGGQDEDRLNYRPFGQPAMNNRNAQQNVRNHDLGHKTSDMQYQANRSRATTNERDIYSSRDNDKISFVPASTDKPVGLDLDEFLPRAHIGRGGIGKGTPEPSDQEVLGVIMRGHEPMMVVLSSRQRSLQLFNSMWMNKNLKMALDSAIAVNDISVLVDILGALVLKPSVWTLDICAVLLPKIYELLQSKYESYMTCGCTTLRLILRNFSSVIKTNVNAPVRTLGVDIPREERYSKSLKCYDTLVEIRSFLLKRQTMQGRLGAAFRDLHSLIQQGLEE